MYDNALVFWKADISVFSTVYGDAMVCGDAKISGDAEIYGDDIVSSNK